MMNILAGLFILFQLVAVAALAIGVIFFGVGFAITSGSWLERHEVFFRRHVTPVALYLTLLVLAYALGSESGGQFKWIF